MKNILQITAAFFIITSAFAQAPDSVLRELPDQRTYFSKTFYNAKDNTYSARISAGYQHYLAGDGKFKDIDTNLRLDKSGAYYIIDNGLYNVAFAAAIGQGNWDVAYEVPKPVQQKFRDPSQPRAPVTRIRWKILSCGYFDRQSKVYQILQNVPQSGITPIVSGNTINYPQIFTDIDARYTCGNVRQKEEIVLSQSARNALPDPAKYGLTRNNSYFVVAMEFLLTPNSINVLARRSGTKIPIKQGNNFSFDGDDPIEFEDETETLHFFFPKDYAWALADSTTGRISLRRYIYSQGGKHYMLAGVPYSWITGSPTGVLIIDPTTSVATNEDVWLEDAFNKDGNGAGLLIGTAAAPFLKKRTIIKFNIAGSGIPSSATVLNAQMKLYYYSANNGGSGAWIDRWVQAHQILVNWSQTQATRDNRLTGTLWNVQYVGLNDIDAKSAYESTLLCQQNYPRWQSWDLTGLTQKWINLTATNYGVVLWATNESTDGYDLRFYSSEAAAPNDIYRPYLQVIYSTETTTRTVYFLKDHLGSIRATVLDSATAPVIGYDDYDPWGYALALRTKAIPNAYLQGASKNKFSGQIWDDDYGLNWYHLGARPYDSQIGRIPVVDRFADKYPSLSPYHYAANNPILFVDANGDSINFSGFIRADKTFKTNVSSTLLSDLQSKTGLSLSVSQNGMLVYATDENGNPIIATDEKGNPVGSAEARNLITNAINATDVVETFLTPAKTSQGAGLQLALNPKQIESFMKGASPGLNPKTLGFGMVFMHELLHTKVGGSLKDPGATFGLTGPVVDRMNIIRSQLGPDYGQRLSYASYPLQGSNYLPFDQAALNRLKKNSLPSTLYIKH